MPRLFDGNAARSSAEFDALIAKYRAVKPGLAYVSTKSLPPSVHHLITVPAVSHRGLKCEDLTNITAFGQKCNRQEHVLYGMCLDGRCCRRSEVEKVRLCCRVRRHQTDNRVTVATVLVTCR